MLLVACHFSLAAEGPPNIITIFIDDMGYGDVGFNGATGPSTPNLDRTAAEGRVFDDFYVGCAVCSGSRTALLTGCHYQRLSMAAVLFPNSKAGLHPDETTIADTLSASGYDTACIGKWHLGHKHKSWPPLMRGEEVVEYPADQTTLTKRYTEQATAFIRAHKDGEKPFFLYLPHTMVHLPLAVSPTFDNPDKPLIHNAIEEVDWSVGQILETLRTTGLAANTLVVFTSDNGATVGSSKPLRAKKGSVYDGGIREPTVMWWPGRIPADTVCRDVTEIKANQRPTAPLQRPTTDPSADRPTPKKR